jgi:leader peptidase (prepilin peptidase)/N-methyltransferase
MSGFIQFFPVLIATLSSLYICIVDIQEMRIPNRVLIPTYVATLILMTVASLAEGELLHVVISLIGSIFATFIFFFIHLMKPKGLGMGDVKFAGLLGLVLSWFAFPSGLWGLALAFVASALFSAVAIVFKFHKVDLLIPFGPFMVFGLLVMEYQHYIA